MEEEIPISNLEDGPFVDEVSEDEVLEGSELSEDVGGYNELPESEELSVPSIDLGDSYIILLESRNESLLAKVIEIDIGNNSLIMEDDENKKLTFRYELSEIIMKTDDYEIIDIIRVKEYKPEDEEEENKEIEIDVDELVDKKYSELAKKDDLLSAMIQSMNIYDNPILIEKVQETIDNLLDLINYTKEDKLEIPYWLIPIVDDELKLYDLLGFLLNNELDEELKSSTDIRNYRDYLNNSLQYSKPIETKSGYGLETNEYSGIYLRNCLQDDNCSSILGSYRYDERKNSKPIFFGDEVIYPSNNLRIVGLLEEPINKIIYSLNYDNLINFSVFEKYIYENLNKKNNLYKKENIYQSLILSSDDKNEKRELNKFILHNLPDNSTFDIFKSYSETSKIDLLELLMNDDMINESIYNYDDIEKLLFKYEIKYDKLSLSSRNKLNNLISKNIQRYKKENKSYFQSKKDEIELTKSTLTDEKRVTLSHNIIFSMIQREERNYYLQKFIDLFTRTSDKETESNDYLYNKYTDKKILCKHYLYEVNIKNDNDVFNTMKSKFGLPPEDGHISCKICGGYLCPEDSTLIEGYDDDKPIQIREVMKEDEEKELEITEYIKENDEPVEIIKKISNSLGVILEKNDIYEILLSYELLDHNILPDIRYGIQDTSINDKHPRVVKEIETLKKEEKEEKNKSKKKLIKSKREDVMKNFQKWLKNTNKILMITSLLSLYIQTSIPAIVDKSRSFDVLDMETKKFNMGSLKYLSVKLRRLFENYEKEKIWNSIGGLLNEKEYGTNEIEKQLGLTIKYCIEPNFPRIISRITRLEEYIELEKHKYLKEEWVTFKPLQKNKLVNTISDYLLNKEEENTIHLRKIYGGTTVENNSLIRTKTESYNKSLSELLEIPEVEIFKNNSFRILFRYAVSLYGKHESNILLTLSFQRLLETCNKRDELLKVFIKNGWNESSESFRELNFQKIRKNLIPEILSIYGDKNTDINSCYSNEKSCNDFIHNAINTYDLPLLNTYSKRIYNYKPPIVYPELPYGGLKDKERYNEDGEQIDNIIEMIFKIYKKDEMGDIVKNYDDNFYLQFYAETGILENEIINTNHFKKIEKNEENFLSIINEIRLLNSLSLKDYTAKRLKYTVEDYDRIDNYSKVEKRFYDYLEYFSDKNKNSNKEIICETLLELLNDILRYEKAPAINDKIDRNLKDCFSNLIYEMENNIMNISKFLSESDNITMNQKRRFESIFKEYNPTQRISFHSKNISSIITLFIMDSNLKYDHLVGYINDIRNIFPRLIHMKNKNTKLSSEWKCSDSVYNEYSNFLNRDGNSVYLYLHNNIFMKTKDTYLGFNSYLNDGDENRQYFQLLYDKIKHYLFHIDKIKGSNSKMNDKYSLIYMKYHFIGLFNEIVMVINDLKDSQSEITSDANDLFQSLESRDEDLIDDMIDILSQFVMDLLTHILFQHYDPTWLFLNEQKLDLSNRLTKQKENEKQVLVEKLDGASRDERFAMMQKQKMGISSWHHESAAERGKYVNSDEYSLHTNDERYERLKQIQSQSNIQLDVMNHQEGNDEIQDISESAILVEEGEDNLQDIEIDEENEDYQDEYLDDEQEQIYNE